MSGLIQSCNIAHSLFCRVMTWRTSTNLSFGMIYLSDFFQQVTGHNKPELVHLSLSPLLLVMLHRLKKLSYKTGGNEKLNFLMEGGLS